jgi:hypothetical protein
VVHVCNPSYSAVEAGGPRVRGQSKQKGSEVLSLQQNKNKRPEGVAQVVEHLLKMHETPCLITSTEEKIMKERKLCMHTKI